MRVIIAARLSKLANGQTGLDTQDIGSRAWAEQNGHTVVAVIADRKSGTTHPWERPKLRPWMTKPELLAQYDAVLGFKLDRISRGDDESTSRIEDWAREHDKQLLTADGLYYPCEGADGIRWDVMKRLAHQEWLSISERYRRMQSHLRQNGFHAGGRIPFGFMMVKVEGFEHKTLSPDPVNAEYIRQAIGRYLSGDSLRTVCAWLDSQNVKPWHAATWSPGSLKRVFINSALYGRTVNSEGKTTLRHEGIVSRETWDKLQDALHGRGSHRTVTDGTAMLTDIAHCARCDGPMYRQKITRKLKDGSTNVHVYYRCHGSERQPSTCRNMVRLADLEAFVTEHITGDPQGQEKIKEVIVIPGHGFDDEIAEIERDIRDVDLDDPEYDAKIKSLRAERARLKALPATDDEVIEREASQTVAGYWAEQETDADKRAFLIESGAGIMVRGPGDYLMITFRPTRRAEEHIVSVSL